MGAESFAIMSPDHVLLVGATFEEINSKTSLFQNSGSVEIQIPTFNDSKASEPTSAIFSNSDMFIRLEQHTLPVRPQLHNQYVLVDTYYRQLHMPEVYYSRLIDVIAIP